MFLAQHLLFATLPGKLWTARATAVLGDDAGLLSHEGPNASGSNAWAVGGERTASGFPLIGGDPHRAIESPGVYQQVRLSCDEFDVLGFAFPGVPGVQHFAHAGDVAWAITNANGDYQDVYDEQLRRTDRGVEALGPDGWERAEARVETITVAGGGDEQVEVVVTPRGPVFSGSVDAGRGLSLRAASVVLDDLGFDAILPLLHARSADDVMTALDDWVEPVNNVVAADRDGAVRFRIAGRVPVRAEANRRGVVDAADPGTAWTGWLHPLPGHDVAPDGRVVTANERRGPESDAIGTTFAPPHRAARIHALLDGRRDLTTTDFRDIHDDALLPSVELFQDLVRDLEPGPAGAGVRTAILGWDGRMASGSEGAAAFAAWRSALTRRLAGQPVFGPLAEPITDDPVLAPWLDVTGKLGYAVEGLLATDAPYRLDVRGMARDALDDAAGHPPTWGATHVFRPVHAFAAVPGLEPPEVPEVPVSGDIDCVRCTGSLPGLSDVCSRGSVARYVWDLADRQAGGWGCRWVRPPTPATRTTSTSCRCGRTVSWRRSSRTGTGSPRSRGCERLLEPPLGVGVVVVPLDLAVARPLVHRDRLEQGAVRVQHHPGVAEPCRQHLELAQHPGAQPGSAPVVGHPHPLDLAGVGREVLDAAVRHRPAVAGRDQEAARVVRPAGVEAVREPLVELGEVATGRLAGHRVGRSDTAEVDGRRAHQQVGGRECRGEPVALPGRQRTDDRLGEPVGPVVEVAPRGLPGLGQGRDPAAPVRGVGVHVDQAVVGEPAQQSG